VADRCSRLGPGDGARERRVDVARDDDQVRLELAKGTFQIDERELGRLCGRGNGSSAKNTSLSSAS
jgi:hypothetical protein